MRGIITEPSSRMRRGGNAQPYPRLIVWFVAMVHGWHRDWWWFMRLVNWCRGCRTVTVGRSGCCGSYSLHQSVGDDLLDSVDSP